MSAFPSVLRYGDDTRSETRHLLSGFPHEFSRLGRTAPTRRRALGVRAGGAARMLVP
ncbi:hypothetical protein ACL02R_03085 [Streptomyces sp. MS19]|uniref:hypothetical protein n=1 Tax=Streptomyces sp. MS19 TaxID=3385972 RepID=UPI0039A25E66